MKPVEARARIGRRLLLALVIGALAGARTYQTLVRRPEIQGADFTYWWRAARHLLEGLDPYTAFVGSGASWPDNGIFANPLPAALFTVPFAGLDAPEGATLFVGLSFALAAYGLLREAPWRLLLLLSAPALMTVENGQWALWLLGAALVPAFGFVLACKPTSGAAIFAWRPTWRAFIGGAALVAACFLVQPTWVSDWLAGLQRSPQQGFYASPIRMPGGFLLALALLKWRRPEARLLLALSLVPQTSVGYEPLPLLMIPNGVGMLAAFVVWTHVAQAAATILVERAAFLSDVDFWVARQPFVIIGLYVPALLMVLCRSNSGTVPAWLEQRAARAPRWLRGTRPGAEGVA